MNTTHDTTTTETTEAESYMDRCARERRERATSCATLAAQLAQAMTTPAETWTAKTDDELHYEHFHLFRQCDGLEMFISGQWNRTKHWHVSLGNLAMPDGTKQSTSSHKHRDEAGETSLNTSKTKTPEQIVRDIRRRLWPFADELCARALAYHQKKTDDENNKAAIRARLKQASRYQLESNDREPDKLTRYGSPHIRAEVRTYGGENVKLEFEATVEQAEQIVRILCQPPKAEEQPAAEEVA